MHGTSIADGSRADVLQGKQQRQNIHHGLIMSLRIWGQQAVVDWIKSVLRGSLRHPYGFDLIALGG